MSFWSTQTLKKKLPDIIFPYNEKNLGSSSYDLTLGEEVYISALPNTKAKDRHKVILDKKGTTVIPPGQFAFLMTEEKIKVPNNTIALINFKFKFKKKASGLINVSGFHVDPGYDGHLIFTTYNIGGSFFNIQRGETIFTIWFVNLDEEDESPRAGKGYNTIPTDLINKPDLLTSLPHLQDRIKDLEKRIDKYSFKQAIIWGALISIIAISAKLGYEHYTNVVEKKAPIAKEHSKE